MKKTLYLLLIVLLFASCGDDKTEEAAVKLELSTYSYVLESGVPSVEIAIISGNGDYKLTSSDPRVAVAYKKVDRLVIAALKPGGSTTITVTDRLGLKASVNFRIAAGYTPVKNQNELVYLEKGGKDKALSLSPFPANPPLILNNTIAALQVKRDTLFATGKDLGVAYAWVGNKEGYLLSSYCFEVLDSYNLNLYFNELTVGFPAKYLFVIKSGNGGYSLNVPSNEIIQDIALRPYIFDGKVIEPQLSNPMYVYVETKAKGTVTVRINDSKGKWADLKLNCTIPYTVTNK